MRGSEGAIDPEAMIRARVPAGVLTMTNGKDEDRCMHGPGYIYIYIYTRSAHLERNMSLLINIHMLRERLSVSSASSISSFLQNRPVSSEHPLKGCRVQTDRQREGEETALTVLLPKQCVYTAAMSD